MPNVFEALSRVKNDIVDTANNTNIVFSVFNCLSSETFSRSDLLSLLNDTKVVNFMYDNTSVHIDFSDVGTDNDVEKIVKLIKNDTDHTEWWEIGYLYCHGDECVFEVSEAQIPYFGTAMKGVSEAYMNSDMLRTVYENATNDKLASLFSDLYSSKVVHCNDSVRDTYELITEHLTANDNVTGLLQLAKGIYTNLESITGDTEDATLGFPDDKYYVAGFCGETILSTSVSIITNFISSITAICAPIISAVSSAVGYLWNAITDVFASVSDTFCSEKPEAVDDLYPQLLYSKSVIKSDLPAICQSFLSKYGCITFYSHNIFWVLLTTDQENVLMQGVIYLNTDYSHLGPITLTSPAGSTKRYAARWLASGNPTLSHYNYPLGPRKVDTWRYNYYAMQAVCSTLMTALSTCGGMTGLYVAPTGTDYESIKYSDDPDTYCMVGIPTCFSEASSFGTVVLENRFASWENIVNYYVPYVRTKLEARTASQIMAPYVSWLISIWNNPRANGGILSLCYGGLMSDRQFRITPPSISTGYIFSQAIGALVVAAAAITISVIAYKVKKKFRNKMHRKLVDIEAAKYRYEASGSDADWNLYYRSVKKYNLLAKFSGQSSLSLWTGTSDSVNEENSTLTSYTILKAIRG